MKLALLTAADRNFFPGVQALLAGAARHHPEIERWCFVPPHERSAAEDSFGHLARIISPPRLIAGVPERLQMGVARLFAPELPADVVAYIDADAVLCRPVPELWEVEPGYWNAVTDASQNIFSTVPSSMREAFARQFPEVLQRKGFNSGVCAFRTAEWKSLATDFEDVLAKGGYESYHPSDQPLLNAMIQPRVRWLPIQFNVNNLFDNTIPQDAKIVHFTGGQCKPWDSRYPRHEPQYYWWLKHGLNETRRHRLFLAWLRILLVTPKRSLGNYFRRRREKGK
jgi:lipopolysaccharide biosynthesis glycosyltransferase